MKAIIMLIMEATLYEDTEKLRQLLGKMSLQQKKVLHRLCVQIIREIAVNFFEEREREGE